jgi:hypothetical protein
MQMQAGLAQMNEESGDGSQGLKKQASQSQKVWAQKDLDHEKTNETKLRIYASA